MPGYLGNDPSGSATKIARQTYTTSGAATTDFTFTSGYDVGYLDVYVNGERQTKGKNFTASDGSTFKVLNGGVGTGSTVEAIAYKTFNLATVDFDDLGNTGNLTLSGDISAVNATFSGDVSIGGTLTYEDVTNIDSVGVITARLGVDIITGGIDIVGNTTGLNVSGVGTFTGDVSIADKIIHTGDTHTAIRFPAADTFTVETGGSEAIRIDGSQRLFVGLTTFTGEASAVLEGSSAGDTVQAQLWLNRGAANPVIDLLLGMINFGDNDAAGHMGAKIDVRTDGNWSAGNYPSRLMFHTTASSESSPTERLRITSGGNVGINEDAPEQRLHVGGDVEIGFASPTDAARQIIFDVNRSSADATIANINWQWNSTNVAQIRGITGADTTNKDDAHLAFFTAAAGSLVERLRITSGGVLLAGATASVGEGGTPADLNSTEIGRGYINIARDDTAAADHILFGKNGAIASSIGTDTTNTIVFKTGTTEAARFDSSGRFGINQSSPQRILHIGESGTAEANVRIQGGADYFELRVKDGDNAFGIHRNIAGGGSNESLRILSGGQVNIGGNYTQTTYTMQVTGTFNATSNITQNGNALATNGKAIAMALIFG